MNDRRLNDDQIAAALRAHLPARAQAGLPERVMKAVEITPQQRSLPSILGAFSDPDLARGRSGLLIAAAILLALAVASAAAVGAWQLFRRDTAPQLDLTPPADLPALVLSMYDRMPDLPPMAITTLTDGSVKGRMYVDRSGAVRFEHYPTPDAPEPDTYEILNGTRIGQLVRVRSDKVWVEQDGAIAEDPREFLLAQTEGDGVGNQPGCGLNRNEGDVGDGAAASGWKFIATEDVVGRPAFHVACGGGDLWIDVQTRLILRSRGPVFNAAHQPVAGSSRTIEVTDLEFGEQPADLFEIALPAGVAPMSSADYQCQLFDLQASGNLLSADMPWNFAPTDCSQSPSPQLSDVPPLKATQVPLPPLAPAAASNGWIAYSTAPRLGAANDTLSGSDLYVVHEGVEPKLIASREGGTTRNVCPAFSPDGSKLAYGVVGPQGRTVVVVGLDANGGIHDPVAIAVPGPGLAVCPRWSSDSKRIAYLLDDLFRDDSTLVVRGLDGSTLAATAGDPSKADFYAGSDPAPLLSPSDDWMAHLSFSGSGCQIVVAKPDGTAAHVITLRACPESIAAWSPDGQQVLLVEDTGGFTIEAVAVDSASEVTIVSNGTVNGQRSWPGRGDLSWQPVFP